MKEVTGFNFKLVIVTDTTNYATCNISEWLSKKDLGRKKFWFKLGLISTVEKFWLIDGASCTRQDRKRHGESYIERVSV